MGHQLTMWNQNRPISINKKAIKLREVTRGIEISSFSIASDADAYTDEDVSQRDLNSPYQMLMPF